MPLRWLLLAVGLAGVVWALVVPAWQAPDEDSHFAYVQTLAEQHRLPGGESRNRRTTELRAAHDASGFQRSYQRLETNPEWTRAAEQRWEREESAMGEAERKDGGGEISSKNNPPTFYLYSAVAYEAAGGTVIDRLYAMRIWSIALLLAFAVAAWLLAGELAGRDRVAQLCAAALAGLLPMVTFISSSVNPDAMLLPLWGFATWLGVRALRHGMTRGRAAALLAATVATVLVKPIAVALLPAVAWVFLVALWRRRGAPPIPARLQIAAVAAVCICGLAVVLALSPRGPAGLADYLWQFYLPELGSQEHIRQLQQWPVRDVWFEGVAGAFGWLEVRFPDTAYVLIGAAVVGLALLAVRGRRGWLDRPLLVFLVLPAVALFVGLHLTEYRYIEFQHEGFIQGRYLLPLVPAGAAAAAAGIATLRGNRQALVVGTVLGGLVLWQVASLAIVVARFYA